MSPPTCFGTAYRAGPAAGRQRDRLHERERALFRDQRRGNRSLASARPHPLGRGPRLQVEILRVGDGRNRKCAAACSCRAAPRPPARPISREVAGRYFMTHLVLFGRRHRADRSLCRFRLLHRARRRIATWSMGVDRANSSPISPCPNDAMRSANRCRALRLHLGVQICARGRCGRRRKAPRRARTDDRATRRWDDLSTVFRQPRRGLAEQAVRKVVLHEGLPVERLPRSNSPPNSSPIPRAASRLGTELDPLGLPKVAVDWQVTAEDQAKCLRDRSASLGAELGQGGTRPVAVGGDR